jgi:hypothetical protein
MQLILFIFMIFLSLKNVQSAEFEQSHYRLPNTKLYLATCAKKSVELGNGGIEKQWILDRGSYFLVEYEIQTNHGIWFVTCDLNDGKILNEKNV